MTNLNGTINHRPENWRFIEFMYGMYHFVGSGRYGL